MSENQKDTCRSEVELATLAPGMAKQHERYHDALQELLDNAVSSVVKNESYFENPNQPITVVITLRRTDTTVRTTIADNGPGIPPETLRNDVFRTGSKEASDGILNNVGWGLKASLAWFEETLSQVDDSLEDSWFTLVTSTSGTSPTRVDGPITGGLPISDADKQAWVSGLGIGDHELSSESTGTRVHVSCSRSKFDADVWPSAKSLEIKAQSLRELIGVKFRRLLDAHPDNAIYIDYVDEPTDSRGSLPVVPIYPTYVDNDEDPPTDYAHDEFTIDIEDGTNYTVEFERGTIDFDAMADELADEHPGLFTTSGRLRTRYRPSQSKQGVDIYANGRVLMTSVFTDLFDLTRNGEYNYFGGEVRVIPEDKSAEVPTDNKKVRLDSNSTLWQRLQETFSQEEYQPEGKRYDDSDGESQQEDGSGSDSDDAQTATSTLTDPELIDSDVVPTDSDNTEDLFAMHRRDSKSLEETVYSSGDIPKGEEFVDVTITSPPYFNLKDYGYSEDDQIGQAESYSEYLGELREIFNQVYNVTKDSGTLWVVVNSFKTNREVVQLPYDIAEICQNLSGKQLCDECGGTLEPNRVNQRLRCSQSECDYTFDRSKDSWLLQDIVIWNKTRGLPYNSDGQFRNVFEYILCFSKTPEFAFDVDKTRIADPDEFKKWWVSYPERYHPRGKVPSNIWEYVTPAQGSFGGMDALDHPAPFPTRLVERILRLTTREDAIVLDPFAGSGMVPAVADIMRRRSIGFELSAEYCSAYHDVRDEVEEAHGDRLRSETSADQRELTKTIGGLRQVKYVRELLRGYADSEELSSHRELPIHTAFHWNKGINPTEADAGRFMESEVHYVADDNLGNEIKSELTKGLKSIAAEDLNSSYGINATIKVHTTEEFLETIASGNPDDGEFYVYEDGRHYEYAEQISLQEWVKQAFGTNHWRQVYGQDEWPPIVSNLGLAVDNPRRKQEGMESQSLSITADDGPEDIGPEEDHLDSDKNHLKKADVETDD